MISLKTEVVERIRYETKTINDGSVTMAKLDYEPRPRLSPAAARLRRPDRRARRAHPQRDPHLQDGAFDPAVSS